MIGRDFFKQLRLRDGRAETIQDQVRAKRRSAGRVRLHVGRLGAFQQHRQVAARNDSAAPAAEALNVKLSAIVAATVATLANLQMRQEFPDKHLDSHYGRLNEAAGLGRRRSLV